MTRPASLILLSGLPGAGKTTFALALARRIAVDHIESDAVRHRITRIPRYTPAEHARVFAEVERLARTSLGAGRIPLIDATNLRRTHRERFFKLAQACSARVIAVRVTAPDATIRARLARPREGFSQAGPDVYHQARGHEEPFHTPVIAIDTRYPIGSALTLIARLLGE